jgi:Mpv17 / PMP22 family
MLQSLRRETLPQLEREYWPALRGSWGVSVLFWPLQWACFRYLPLQLRVMSINVCDVAWTAVLSFFSHKGDADDESEQLQLQHQQQQLQQQKQFGRQRSKKQVLQLTF